MTDLLKFSGKAIVLAFIALLFSCQPKEWVRNHATGPALGTGYSIIYLTHEPMDLEAEIDSVFRVMNQSMSTYVPDSDISKINRGDNSVVVDDMFRDVFEASKDAYQTSKGYFDPTVGVLVDAWGFGPGRQIEMDSSKVDSLLEYVGFDKVRITDDNHIIKDKVEIRFDFNAVAKGYAIDRLGEMLNDKGIENYLVEVGGELLAKGENRQRMKRWIVGIDDPQVIDGIMLKQTIYLKNRAMASSGNYRKFRIDSITGEKYVHTIDPKTGFTKNSKILSSTVLTETCARADAYATAFMAMDLEASREILANEDDLQAYIIYLDDEGKTREFMTVGFSDLLVN